MTLEVLMIYLGIRKFFSLVVYAHESHHSFLSSPDILNNTVISIENPPFRPESSVGSIVNFDPDFSANSFAYLANNLVLAGYSLGEICDINAEVSQLQSLCTNAGSNTLLPGF